MSIGIICFNARYEVDSHTASNTRNWHNSTTGRNIREYQLFANILLSD
jgi:hypothetical protein